MAESLREILVGRKILDGKVLSVDYDARSPNVILVERFLSVQMHGEIFQARFERRGTPPFLLKIPAEPLAHTNEYIQNEIDKLEMLAIPGDVHIPVIQKSFILGGQKKLPFYISSVFSPEVLRFPALAGRQPSPSPDVLTVFYLLANALKYLARHSVVHGNLCPETVQFSQKMPVLTHFVAARSIGEISLLTQEDVAVYDDPRWLPPEVLTVSADPNGLDCSLNLKNFSDKTDVWGIGLLLMYYLTGNTIYDEVSPERDPVSSLQGLAGSSAKRLLVRYRNRCKTILESQYAGDDEESFIDEISQLLKSAERPEKGLSALDAQLVRKYDLLGLADTACKLAGFGRQKSLLLKETYLRLQLALFDLCTAPIEDRANANQLLAVLDCLLPGLAARANSVRMKPGAPQFMEGGGKEPPPLAQTARFIKTQKFQLGDTKSMEQHTRARPRHSLQQLDQGKMNELVQRERQRYFSNDPSAKDPRA